MLLGLLLRQTLNLIPDGGRALAPGRARRTEPNSSPRISSVRFGSSDTVESPLFSAEDMPSHACSAPLYRVSQGSPIDDRDPAATACVVESINYNGTIDHDNVRIKLHTASRAQTVRLVRAVRIEIAMGPGVGSHPLPKIMFTRHEATLFDRSRVRVLGLERGTSEPYPGIVTTISPAARAGTAAGMPVAGSVLFNCHCGLIAQYTAAMDGSSGIIAAAASVAAAATSTTVLEEDTHNLLPSAFEPGRLALLRPGRTCLAMGTLTDSATPFVAPGVFTLSCRQWLSLLASPNPHHRLLVHRILLPRLRMCVRTTLIRGRRTVEVVHRPVCRCGCCCHLSGRAQACLVWSRTRLFDSSARAYIWKRRLGRSSPTLVALLHDYVYWGLRAHNRLCAALSLSAIAAWVPSAFEPSSLF